MDTAAGMADVRWTLATNDACVVADDDFTPRRDARLLSEVELMLMLDT
jgi:hypothetical protein